MKKILLIFSLLLYTCAVFAQTRTITGTITSSDKNEPLVGVTVRVKGSNTATQTDVNGKYAIKVTNAQNVVLSITYVGYAYQERTLRIGENNYDARLEPSKDNSLEDVVVVGYGTQKKGTLTGSVSTVDLKKVEDIPALSMSAIIRGTMPGVSVSGGTQRPGQPATITIRNPVVLSRDSQQGNGPIYVIDDVIRTQADFELLDPIQVESVTVLKDAEASIYGISGANGVVQVRTKRGKAGAPRISFSSSLGASNATMLPKMMNSTQLATWVNDYYQGQASIGPFGSNSYYAAPGFQAPYYNADGFLVTPGSSVNTTTNTISNTGAVTTGTARNTNWYTPDELAYFADHSHNYLKEAFKTAYVWREAINISGGSDKVNYFVGGDYVNQNSNFKGINSYKYGLRASVEIKPAKGLTTFLSLSNDVSYTRNFWYKLNSTTESLDNDAASLENIQPWQEYFINGNPVSLGGSLTGGYDNLNFFQVQNSDNFTGGKSYVMNILGKITYQIPGIKGLTATATMNKNINAANNKQFGTTFNYYRYAGLGANNHIPGGNLLSITPISNGDKVRLTPTFSESYQLDAGLNYDRTFGKHAISALALFEQREQMTEGVAAEANGVVPGALPYQTFAPGTSSSTQANQISQAGFQSFISRFNYAYDNKYLVQLIYRADGSSRFAPGNNWGGFPAASVGWVVSQESFFRDHVEWVDNLKLRASVGLTGTDATKAYQYVASYNVGTGSSGGAVFNEGARSTAIKANIAIPNPGVVWDHVLKTDYGMDAQFLRNRLNFTADYYWSHGYDLLANLTSSVPATIGAAVPTENYGSVNVFGYELSLGWRDHIGKNFTYSFSPFFAWSDNKYIKYDIAQANIGTIQDLTGGSSDRGVLGWKSLGIIKNWDEANAIIAQRAAAAGIAPSAVKIFGQPVQPGMINYEDLNGDGVITDDIRDEKYLTKRASNHNSLGLNFSVGYGSLNLNVIMGMSWGGWTAIDGRKPANQSSSATGASIADNRPVYWADHWTPTNTDARFPAPYFVNNYDRATDFWLVPATTLNISSANLSYTLPTRWVSRLGMSSARVYAVATNPVYFINPYPEKYRDFGASLYTYPSLRTVSFGLNVGF